MRMRFALVLAPLLLAGCADGVGYGGGSYDPHRGDALINLGAQMMRRPEMPVYQPQNITCQNFGTFTNCHSW